MSDPSEKQIYARRRVLALVAVVAALALIWLGGSVISSLLSGTNSEPEALEVEAEAPQTTAAVEPIACPPGSVLAEAFVGDEEGAKQSFGSGETPLIWYSLTNLGPVPCVFNAGARGTFFTISSGEETIWDSKHCNRQGDTDLSVLLQPNLPFLAEKAPWLKVRSVEGEGCGEEQRKVVTGGASYHLKVEVNGEISMNRQQFLLN